MSDMPDFDSMTPEETMRWMESLAKRQGATEGLTTDADMEVEEIDENDERLAGKGDYVPYGWTEEKWKEHLAKEEAEKRAKAEREQAAQAPVAQPPAPAVAPQPAAEFDPENMSPEELMRWMESLAKRQGATEGMTTSADMEVEEIDENDERLAGKGDYVPYGWTEEKWKEHLAKEEAMKAAKAQQAPAAPEPVADVDAEDEYEDEELAAALAGNVLDAPDLDDIFGGNNLLGDDDDYEDEYDEDDEEMMAPAPDFSAIFGGDDDEDDEEMMAPAPDFSAIFGGDDEEEPATADMGWLNTLGGDDDSGGLDLGALGALAGDVASDNPMDWLGSLAGGDVEEERDGIEEGSLEWMESLARQEGADSEELITGADFEIPTFDTTRAGGPGYEPYSFEEGTGTGADLDDEELPVASFNVEELELENPEAWLDSLASNVGGQSSSIDDDDLDLSFMEDLTEEDAGVIKSEAVLDETFTSMTDELKSKLERGTASPDEIAQFFGAAFDQADRRADVPYLDQEEKPAPEIEEDIDLVEAEIPDWLQQSMETVPVEEQTTKTKRTTAEMMAAELFPDDEEDLVEAEIPDWLQAESSEQDTGDISEIFADAAAAPQELPTDDTWVEAFVSEGDGSMEEWYQSALAGIEGGEAPAAPAQPVASQAAAPVSELKAANLPLETDLPQGTPMLLPPWMGGEDIAPAAVVDERPARGASQEIPGVEAMDMSWLSSLTDDEDTTVATIDDDMPEWLKEQVDDSVTADEDVPDWLAEADIDLDAEDVPAWLIETMDEEADAISSQTLDAIAAQPEPQLPIPAPTPTAPVVVQASPAPVPVAAANIDVGGTLQAARSKSSAGDIDGALMDYETVIRSNQALDQVEKDVSALAEHKDHKKHPGVYRVLGDVLMRRGKLQDALDTYRRALNLL